MELKIVGSLVVGFALLQFVMAKPQQQSVWIIPQQYNDGDIPNNVSFGNVPEVFLTSLLKRSTLSRRKEITKCYRDDIPTISIKLYYEGLCPGCMYYVKYELYPTYQKLGKYINVGLFPYGNTRTEPTPDSEGKYTPKSMLLKEVCKSPLFLFYHKD